MAAHAQPVSDQDLLLILLPLHPWGIQLHGGNRIHQAHSVPTYTPPTRDLPEATFVCLGGYTYRKTDASPGDKLRILTVGGFTLSLSPRL